MHPSRETKATTRKRPAPAKVDAAPLLGPEPAPSSKLSAARAAVQHFLETELKGREIRVTKIGPANHGGGDGWLAEAEIFVPDLGIKTLGLPLTQEVLEREHYLIELDADLTVVSYEVADPQDE